MNHVVICTILLGVLLSITASSGQQDLCSLPPVTGPCRARMPMFYFNQAAGECQRFTYGGCGGNENRFRTHAECRSACVLKLSPNPDCNLPNVSGLCLAYMPSYFYNVRSGQCESFIYGGCGGNSNRFLSKADCEQACVVIPADACNQPKETGPCRASIPRWYYNSVEGTCLLFTYGGCRGNDNNFVTEQQCLERCTSQQV